MTQMTIAKNWLHDDHGEVEVVSEGHFPDTVMVHIKETGQVVECPIAELVSEEDSNKMLEVLLAGIAPSKG